MAYGVFGLNSCRFTSAEVYTDPGAAARRATTERPCGRRAVCLQRLRERLRQHRSATFLTAITMRTPSPASAAATRDEPDRLVPCGLLRRLG